MTAPVIGVILAGGAGQRLGGDDKGLRPLAGRPLVAHVAAALEPQVDELLIVANRNLATYGNYARVIDDGQSGHAGPLAGLTAALRHVGKRRILSVPVDCPRPPADLRRRLEAALQARDRCAVAFDGTRRQPLFALYVGGLATTAAVALDANQPVWRWQDALDAVAVDFADAAANFVNLNTADDFDRYARRQAAT